MRGKSDEVARLNRNFLGFTGGISGILWCEWW